MQSRAARVTVMALLIAIMVTVGVFLWMLDRRTDAVQAARAETTGRIARMVDAVVGIGTAQQGYVAPGQLDEPWFERTSTLTAQLSAEIDLAVRRMRSAAAAEILQSLAASRDVLVATDARTRQNLSLGQDLMASDVIFSDGRNLLDGMLAALRNVQAAEDDLDRAELETIARERTIALTGGAVLWLVGLLVLSRAPRSAPGQATSADAQQSAEVPRERPAAPAAHPAAERRPTIDLSAAAALCTDLSRLTTTAALPDLLARAAAILDASGLILWVSAGDQLFPVMGHGYGSDMVTRLEPVSRSADNAAAEAWRSGRLTTVAASPGTPGAIVAPLFGLHACVGVLTAEVRNGVEHDEAVQAVATMLCAQLATVIPAWPVGALPQEPAAEAAAQVRSA